MKTIFFTKKTVKMEKIASHVVLDKISQSA